MNINIRFKIHYISQLNQMQIKYLKRNKKKANKYIQGPNGSRESIGLQIQACNEGDPSISQACNCFQPLDRLEPDYTWAMLKFEENINHKKKLKEKIEEKSERKRDENWAMLKFEY